MLKAEIEALRETVSEICPTQKEEFLYLFVRKLARINQDKLRKISDNLFQE